MRIFSILLTLSTLILGCKKKNSQIDPQSQCLAPTEVNIQYISGQEVSFDLVGTDSASVGKVSWTIISKEKTVQIETNGKTKVTQSFSQSGEFRVTAVVNTTCQSKVTLTRSENIKIEEYTLQWTTDIGPFIDSTYWVLAESPNGGCVAVGSGASYPTIINLNKEGNIIWKTELQDSNYERINSVVKADDGGYILGGQWYNGEARYGIVKISPMGEKVWEKTFSGIGNPFSGQTWDRLTRVINASDGGYILAGYSSSLKGKDKSDAPKNADAPRNYTLTDYWIIKVDAQGNKVWDKTIGGKDPEALINIIATSEGGYLLSGWSSSQISGDKTKDADGVSDLWLVKISKTGTIEWDRSTSYPTGWGNSVDTDDFMVLLTYNGVGSIQIKKVNIQGTVIWEREIQGSYATLLSATDGGFIMIGKLNQDNFIKFSNDGNIQYRKKIDLGDGILSGWHNGVTNSTSGGFYGISYSGKNKNIFYVK